MYVNIIIVLKCESLEDIGLRIFQSFNGFRCYVVCYENDFNSVKVAFIRPVLYGCHSYEGIMYSTDSTEVQNILKSKNCNLNGSVLTLSVNKDLPYCDLEYENGVYSFKDSLETLMIDILAKKFNFVYDIIYANQSWGTYENGVWLGSIGHLYNKSADIAICDLTRSYLRSEAADYTNAYILVPITFVTTKPGLKSRKWITITPFSTVVWLLMFISFIVTTILMQLLYAKCVFTDKRIDCISMSLIGGLLQQSDIRIPSAHFSIRFYMGMWFISSLILMKTYSGIFYSVLTVPEYKDPIETLEDLVETAESGDYDIITFPLSYYKEMFTRAQCCGAYYTIGERMKNTLIPFPETTEIGIELINESKQRNVIFINTFISLSFGVRSGATVDMHISSETLMMDHLAMALRQGSPLLNAMNERIDRFLENGLFDYWMARVLNLIPAKFHLDELPLPSEGIKNLKLSDLQSIFYICISGLVISLLMFFIEIVILVHIRSFDFSRISHKIKSFLK